MTLFHRTILVLSFVCVASPAFTRDKPHVPTIDDLLNIDAIGGAHISPNGKWVAYSVTHTDFKKDAFLTHLWIADPASGRKYQLTRGDKSAGDAAWSPDSTWLAFTSGRAGDKSQLFAIPPDGGLCVSFFSTTCWLKSPLRPPPGLRKGASDSGPITAPHHVRQVPESDPGFGAAEDQAVWSK